MNGEDSSFLQIKSVAFQRSRQENIDLSKSQRPHVAIILPVVVTLQQL